MESALVRKDAVMLHDPMRTHKRATLVGVIIGVAGLLGFLIVGILNPAQSLPGSGIVIAQPSGQVYVVNQNPHELIPVFNLTSARLLLLAQSSQQSGSSGSTAQQATSVPSVVPPTVVDDTQLAGVPMGRLTGIPDGPQALPTPGSSAENWAVCDNIPRNNTPSATANETAQSTVLVGQPNIGKELPAAQALLVVGPDGTDYLVYREHATANDANDSAVKAQVDLNDQDIQFALQLENTPVRPISAALLDAIPTVGPIVNPFKNFDNVGSAGPQALAANNLTIGQVFQVVNSDNSSKFFAVVSGNTIESVNKTTADIIRTESGGTQQTSFVQVSPASAAAVRQVTGVLPNVDTYPADIPQVLNADTEPVVCLGWSANLSDPKNFQVDTRVTVDTRIETPTDPVTGAAMTPVAVGTPGPNGVRIDSFFMNPDANGDQAGLADGLAVRAANGAGEFASGPIRLITPRGVVYSVDSVTTAQALGIGNTSAFNGMFPAPESIVGLLPTGSEELNIQNVQRTFDSVPVPETAGQYTSVATQQGG
jgi:type VII secretion protein EccB